MDRYRPLKLETVEGPKEAKEEPANGPIIACIGDPRRTASVTHEKNPKRYRDLEEQLKAYDEHTEAIEKAGFDLDNPDWFYWEKEHGKRPESVYVDYYGSESKLKSLGIKNGGFETYVISKIDEQNKSSDQYSDCIGVFAVGREGAKNISFLSHQNPYWLTEEALTDRHSTHVRLDLIEDLGKSLHELKHRSDAGTIDIVIFGGAIQELPSYVESIKMIGKMSLEILGIDPTVVTEPTEDDGDKDMALGDTQKRRLFLLHTLADDEDDVEKPFKASEVEEKTKKLHSAYIESHIQD